MEERWDLLYNQLMNDKRHFQNEAWEALKYFTTIYTAILSITTILVTNMHNTTQKIDGNTAFFIIFLPLCGIIISAVGWYNFKRTNAKAFEIVASLMKVEKLLGFHDKINEKDRYFVGDEYALPTQFVHTDEEKLNTTEQFVDWMLIRGSKFGKFYSTFTNLFRIFAGINIVLIVLILVMLLPR